MDGTESQRLPERGTPFYPHPEFDPHYSFESYQNAVEFPSWWSLTGLFRSSVIAVLSMVKLNLTLIH